MIGALMGLPGKTGWIKDWLQNYWTVARAQKLDYLPNETVAKQSTQVLNTTLTDVRAAYLDYLKQSNSMRGGGFLGKVSQMPLYINLEYVATSANYPVGSNQFNSWAYAGGRAAPISSANTWTEITDGTISGSGFFHGAIAPSGWEAQSKTVGIRVTLDGTAYTYEETFDLEVRSTLILGMKKITSLDGYYSVAGLVDAICLQRLDNISYATIIDRYWDLSCRYESSLKVEVKCSVVRTTGGGDYGYAFYTEDR